MAITAPLAIDAAAIPLPRLVVAVASSALFDLAESDQVFRSEGREAYRAWQRERESRELPPGVAFPFIRRLLSLNRIDPQHRPVEVVLISRNDPDTGLRVRHSLDHFKLGIERSVFTGGAEPWPYLDAFEATLFLSANAGDVEGAIRAGHAAGTVLPSAFQDDTDDELRIAFDMDGVLADDASERLVQAEGLAAFHASERAAATTALPAGPLKRFLDGIGALQQFELERERREPGYRRRLRTGIITARSHPADVRVIRTLRAWNVQVDFTAFIGHLSKDRIVSAFRPHIFFDDKPANAQVASTVAPAVHVPFGVMNGR